MTREARQIVYRVNMRLAQMCGEAWTLPDTHPNSIWISGLIHAWLQIQKLWETGNVYEFPTTAAVPTDQSVARKSTGATSILF